MSAIVIVTEERGCIALYHNAMKSFDMATKRKLCWSEKRQAWGGTSLTYIIYRMAEMLQVQNSIPSLGKLS